MLTPQPVNKDISGHLLVLAQDENSAQRQLLLPADIEEMPVHADLDRPEQPVLDSRRGPQMQPPSPALLTVAGRTRYRKLQRERPARPCELFVRSSRDDQVTASRGAGAGMKLTGFEPSIRDYWRSQRQRGLAG